MGTAIVTNMFLFNTKAQNLAQLRNTLEIGKICDLEVITVDEWRENNTRCLSRVSRRFCGQKIIVRSSAPNEDSIESSSAGAFESVACVDAERPDEVVAAVETVINSYQGKALENISGYELLIQPMVTDVLISGVLFTRDLDRNAPYYVLNYDDESSRTDTVTAGLDSGHKILRISKYIDFELVNPTIRTVLQAAQELEILTGNSSLDIEFAVNKHRELYILQVRPLVRTKILSLNNLDRKISAEIHHMKQFVREKCLPNPNLYGDTTIFGEMPDWNPAEIIGTQPKPLAFSLYSYLIMKSAWREARRLMGYKHPFPHQLMVNIGGRPYVDVRNSFNSFLPSDLPDTLSHKLVNHYLKQLALHPEFHDKVEFEIVLTCMTPDFAAQSKKLQSAGFTKYEITTLKNALLNLTKTNVQDSNNLLHNLQRRVRHLQTRRNHTLQQHKNTVDIPIIVEKLLEDCIHFGTIPFSVFARCAFIGTAFLRSFLNHNLISEARYNDYLQSIETITTQFVTDLEPTKKGYLDTPTFLERYGHLRPGTYDICSYTYSEKPDLYLDLRDTESIQTIEKCTSHQHNKSNDRGNDLKHFIHSESELQSILDTYKFTFSVQELNSFIIQSIQLREMVKFEFTKNLSLVLNLMVKFGKYHGISREDLSFIPIELFINLSNQNMSEYMIELLREIIERNKKRYELTSSIYLPDLIFSESDIEIVEYQRKIPNFVTQKQITAPSYYLENTRAITNDSFLKGKIVLIQNADPGYDWLFTKKIAGLITKFGGAASHMTIRCAEFGLPAAIGCGEQIFSLLEKAKSIRLDCLERKVDPTSL